MLGRGFELFGVRKDKIVAETPVGRDWVSSYPGIFKFEEGLRWGDVRLALLPAFAGLGDEVLDKTSIAALSAMPYAFANARASDFTVAARHAVSALTNRAFNPVRLLWRLAVLWLSAAMSEDQGSELLVRALEGAAEPRFVNGPAELNTMLVEAAQAREQTVFVDVGHEVGRPTKVLEALLVACASRPMFASRASSPMPTLLKAWPSINGAQLSVYGSPAVPVEPGALPSAAVWDAATLYVRQHGLYELWTEVLEAVAVHALRPEGDQAWVGHSVACLALPKSELSPDGLGPLSQPLRAWTYATRTLGYPEPAELLWRGASRYSAMSVSLSLVAAELGADTLTFEVMRRRRLALLELQARATEGYVPMNYIANEVMSAMDWVDGFGRIHMCTYGGTPTQGAGGCGSLLLTYLAAPGTVQWEEILPYVKVLPITASVSATLYPVRPNIDYPIGRWMTCNIIEGRAGTSDAMYCVGKVAGNEVRYAKLDSYGQATTYARYTPRLNYRGAPADHQYGEYVVGEGLLFRPVFKSSNARAVMETHLQGRHNSDIDWFLSDVVSTTFSAILAEYGTEPDTPTASSFAPGELDVPQPAAPAADEVAPQAGYSSTASDAQRRLVEEQVAREHEEQTSARRSAAPASTLRTTPHVKPDIKVLTWCDKLADIMGTAPELTRQVVRLQQIGPNPVAASRAHPGLVQQVMAAVAEVDPVTYAAVMPPASRAQGMRLLGNLLTHISSVATTGSSQMDLLRLSSACRQLAANFTVSPIMDPDEYQEATGRPLPEAVRPLLQRGLMAGIPLGEIVNSSDVSRLEARIAESERMLEAAVAEAVEAEEPPGGFPVGAVDGGPTAAAAAAAERHGSGGDSNSPLPPGPEAEPTTVVEPQQPDQADFGGAAPSADPLETAQSSPESAAEAAAAPSGGPLAIAFGGQRLLD